jgi:hypothetical protein
MADEWEEGAKSVEAQNNGQETTQRVCFIRSTSFNLSISCFINNFYI